MLLNNYKYLSNFIINISSNEDKYKLAEAVLILKKKSSLTLMNMDSQLLKNLESVS